MFDHYNQIETYRNQIINITNASGLTVGMAYYVLKDVLNSLYLTYLEQKNHEEQYQDQEYTEDVDIEIDREKIKNLTIEELEEEIKNETE